MRLNVLQSIFASARGVQQLSEETRRRLERVAEQRHYRRRHIVHFADQPGDYIYLLCDGRVKITRVSDQGREVTLYIVLPGQIFGEEALSSKDIPYGVTAETLEDSLVIAFRRSDFLEVLLQTPDASLELIRIINERRCQAESKIADLVFLDVPKRLVKLLLEIYEGTAQREDGLIPEKFTHQELANLIGSTRETTTLILNDLRRRGTIDFLGRKIVIRNRTALETILMQDSGISGPALLTVNRV
jgi:CRP/FNR family cyclic AMP-dependent transcriptional regulator